MEESSLKTYSQQYKQVEALTLTEESKEIDGESFMSISTFLSLSLFIFFFVVIFLGFIPMLIERFRDFKRFQMALLLAFVGAALPLTMGLVFQRTGFLTSASVEEIPRNVRIVDVEASSFRVKWETNGEQYGSLRYGTEPYHSALKITVLEVDGLVRKINHEVLIEKLSPEVDYYFEILSSAKWYDNSGVLLHTKTLPEE